MGSIELTPDTGVIVTGGASGIGRASAAALAEVGRPVAIWDLDATRCERAAEAIAKDFDVAVAWRAFDIRHEQEFPAAIADARAKLGSIGGLVHSAGVSNPVPIDEIDRESWNTVIDINLSAHALLVKALLPELASQRGSAIVGIASINALLGNAANPAYSASKAGLLGLTRSLADRLAPEGIRINAVCPGYIRTPMQDDALAAGVEDMYVRQCMMARMAEPEEVATVVRFLLSDQASYMTAEHVIVDGGVVPSQH